MKKRIHNILLLIVALFSISSCSKPSTENVATLTIATKEGAPLNGASIVLASEGEQYLFAINSNTEWSIGCNAEWITFSATEGLGSSEVTVSADATMISRSAVVIIYTLNGQQIRASFNVVQHANAEQNPEEKPNQEPRTTQSNNPKTNPNNNPKTTQSKNLRTIPNNSPKTTQSNNLRIIPTNNLRTTPSNNPKTTQIRRYQTIVILRSSMPVSYRLAHILLVATKTVHYILPRLIYQEEQHQI